MELTTNFSASLSPTEEKVFTLLCQGLDASVVASTLSLSQSFISQLLSRDEFRAEVAKVRLLAKQKFISRDTLLEEAELMALEKLKKTLPLVVKPSEVARIYQILNSSKRALSTTAATPSDSPTLQQVTINLPKNASVSFRLSHDTAQVIEVEGRSMAPAPKATIDSLAEARQRLVKLTTNNPKSSPTLDDI